MKPFNPLKKFSAGSAVTLASGLLALALQSQTTWAGACCASGSGSAATFYGDEKSVLAFGVTHRKIIGDAPIEGKPVFRAVNDLEHTQTFTMSGSTLLTDTLQAGATVPIERRSIDRPRYRKNHLGIGDVSFSATHETYSPMLYSVWIPKFFTQVSLTTPTGFSTENMTKPEDLIRVHGRGYASIGLSETLVKAWSNWDLSASMGVTSLLGGTLDRPSGLRLQPVAGFGYSPTFLSGWRMGVQLGYLREAFGSATASSKFQTSAELGYLMESDESLLLSYQDETLLGPAQQSELGRTVLFQFKKRWLR